MMIPQYLLGCPKLILPFLSHLKCISYEGGQEDLIKVIKQMISIPLHQNTTHAQSTVNIQFKLPVHVDKLLHDLFCQL